MHHKPIHARRVQLALATLAVTLALSLSACGGGDEVVAITPQTAIQKMGYGESELYDPQHNPQGHVLGAGETAVLHLEAASAPAASGDTGTPGVDTLWLQTDSGGPVQLSLDDEGLALIARAELLDANGQVLLDINNTRHVDQTEVVAGRYALRLSAAHQQANTVPVFIQLPPAAARTTVGLGTAALSGPAAVDTLRMTLACPGCDLTRADLMYANLSGADLSMANLTYANLKFAKLPGANLSGAKLLWAQFTHADLSGANLSNANLSFAGLLYANLTGANVTGADFFAAEFTFATWTDGRKCAAFSYGYCR